MVIYLILNDVAPELKEVAYALSNVGARGRPHIEVTLTYFQLNLGSLGFQEFGLCWMSCAEPFHVLFFQLFFFLCFKTSPNLVQLFRRILPHCFAEKLKKYFVDYKTSPDFPSAWRWADNDWIFYFWVGSPRKSQYYKKKIHIHLCTNRYTTDNDYFTTLYIRCFLKELNRRVTNSSFMFQNASPVCMLQGFPTTCQSNAAIILSSFKHYIQNPSTCWTLKHFSWSVFKDFQHRVEPLYRIE